jgi:hypothetical protein
MKMFMEIIINGEIIHDLKRMIVILIMKMHEYGMMEISDHVQMDIMYRVGWML